MRFQRKFRCDFCASTESKPYLKTTKVSWYGKDRFELHSCVNCNLVMAFPRPDRDALYKDFFEGADSAQRTITRKLSRPNVLAVHEKAVERAEGFFKEANDGRRPKVIFDMGFGAGTLMEAARLKEMEAEGNEINLAGVHRMQDLGFNAHHGFTRDLSLEPERFDMVFNFDYLEHSYEPFQDLKTCNALLKGNGILYLKTLYLDCPDHLLKGPNYQLLGQGHFSYFWPRTLLCMFQSAGFEILELRMTGLIYIIAKKVGPPLPKISLNFLDHRYAMVEEKTPLEVHH
ncbi:methyltransferase domain-containing protein [Pseudovibrio exalbescens]|uniref:Uncharacterized protein n=1 Tax=Pseudovibrio exalbescens TaxID=197461 RepID=A0A1U7JFH2_9HYPH|nr:methyltransferase domain-containing protein [Pseudovibrio exalbescens]OKL43391.1 hypothetical protein A3843_12065 [Pseudovibrio exalbescens]